MHKQYHIASLLFISFLSYAMETPQSDSLKCEEILSSEYQLYTGYEAPSAHPTLSPRGTWCIGWSHENGKNPQVVIYEASTGKVITSLKKENYVCIGWLHWAFLDDDTLVMRTNRALFVAAVSALATGGTFKNIFNRPTSNSKNGKSVLEKDYPSTLYYRPFWGNTNKIVCVNPNEKGFEVVERISPDSDTLAITKRVATQAISEAEPQRISSVVWCSSQQSAATLEGADFTTIHFYSFDNNPRHAGCFTSKKPFVFPLIGEFSPEGDVLACSLKKNDDGVLLINCKPIENPYMLATIPIETNELIAAVRWNSRLLSLESASKKIYSYTITCERNPSEKHEAQDQKKQKMVHDIAESCIIERQMEGA